VNAEFVSDNGEPFTPPFSLFSSLPTFVVSGMTLPTGQYCDGTKDASFQFINSYDSMQIGNKCGNYARVILYGCSNSACSTYTKFGEGIKSNDVNPTFNNLGISNTYFYECYNCGETQATSCQKVNNNIIINSKTIATDKCSTTKLAVIESSPYYRYECASSGGYSPSNPPTGFAYSASFQSSGMIYYRFLRDTSCTIAEMGTPCPSVGTCPNGETKPQDSFCNVLPCVNTNCPTDTRTCPDGTVVKRNIKDFCSFDECPVVTSDPCSKCTSLISEGTIGCSESECTSLGISGQCNFYERSGAKLNYCSSLPPKDVCCRNVNTGVFGITKIQCSDLNTDTIKHVEVDNSFCTGNGGGETPQNLIARQKGIDLTEVSDKTEGDLRESLCSGDSLCESGSRCRPLSYLIEKGEISKESAIDKLATHKQIIYGTVGSIAGSVGLASLCAIGTATTGFAGLPFCAAVLGTSGAILGGTIADAGRILADDLKNQNINSVGYCINQPESPEENLFETFGNYINTKMFKTGLDDKFAGVVGIIAIILIVMLIFKLAK